MRTLKFRAWDKEKMLYRGLCDKNWYALDNRCIHGTTPLDHILYPIMQFTGLLDKNGAEIYEGDIVSIMDCEPSLYKICYWDNNFKWVVENIGKDPSCWVNDNLEEYEDYHLEVIGNIYENPELMGVNNV